MEDESTPVESLPTRTLDDVEGELKQARAEAAYWKAKAVAQATAANAIGEHFAKEAGQNAIR